MNNIFLTYKWLAELNGILCKSQNSDTNPYQVALLKALSDADRLIKSHNNPDGSHKIEVDEHFQFLLHKKNNKVISFNTFFYFAPNLNFECFSLIWNINW